MPNAVYVFFINYIVKIYKNIRDFI